jgi:hypothetical protein
MWTILLRFPFILVLPFGSKIQEPNLERT